MLSPELNHYHEERPVTAKTVAEVLAMMVQEKIPLHAVFDTADSEDRKMIGSDQPISVPILTWRVEGPDPHAQEYVPENDPGNYYYTGESDEGQDPEGT